MTYLGGTSVGRKPLNPKDGAPVEHPYANDVDGNPVYPLKETNAADVRTSLDTAFIGPYGAESVDA